MKRPKPSQPLPPPPAPASERVVLFHHHIYKNGGTTIDEGLRRSLGPQWTEIEASDPNSGLDPHAVVEALRSRPDLLAISSHTARFPLPEVAGAVVFPIVLIRHPIDRIGSIYAFERKTAAEHVDGTRRAARELSLPDFIRASIDRRPELICNAQTSWMARQGDYFTPPERQDLVRALRYLQSLPVVGVVERLDEFRILLERRVRAFLPEINLAVAAQNRSESRPSRLRDRLRAMRAALGPALYSELSDRNEFDRALWRAAVKESRRQWMAVPDHAVLTRAFSDRVERATQVAPAGTPPPENNLVWTGERLVSATQGDIVAEHLHRYALALRFAAGKDVLDVACGEGYGSALLATVAGTTIGVDIDEPTVLHARSKYSHPNLRFEVGRVEALPLADASIDLIVSFETLEHVADHAAMMGEFKRVLRPEGTLLLSSPDREVYGANAITPNPFHVRELSFAELRQLVGAHFAHASFARQRIVDGSLITPEGPHASIWTEFSGNFESVSDKPTGKSPYLLVLASDAGAPVFDQSLFNWRTELSIAYVRTNQTLHRVQDLYRDLTAMHDERLAWARSLDAELAKTREAFAAASALVDERTTWARSLDSELNKTRAALIERETTLVERTAWAKDLDAQRVAALAERQRLDAEMAKLRDALAATSQLADERTVWARSLDSELNRARAALAEREATLAERTAWAKNLDAQRVTALAERQRLDAELAKLREALAAASKLADERTVWARSLDTELNKARAILTEREAALVERTTWAKNLDAQRAAAVAERQRLETELAKLREALAAGSKLTDERTAWARSLDTELTKARVALTEREAALVERTAWAKNLDTQRAAAVAERQRLETELAKLREAIAASSKLADERSDLARSLDTDLKHALASLSERESALLERTAHAKGLETQHTAALANLRQRETELAKLREAIAASSKLADERGALARSLDRDLKKALASLAEREAALAERTTAWVKDLEAQRAASLAQRQRMESELAQLRRALEASAALADERGLLARTAETKSHHLQSEIDRVRTELVETQAERDAVVQGLTRTRSDLDTAAQQGANHQNYALALEELSRRKQARLDALALAVEQLAIERTRHGRDLVAAQQHLDASTTTLATEQESHARACAADHAALARSEARAAALEAELAQVRARLARYDASRVCRWVVRPIVSADTPLPAAPASRPPVERIQHDLDTPQPLSAPAGRLELSGWVRSSVAPARAVRLRLGDQILECESGLPRPDVALALPAPDSPPAVGFRLHAWVPPGLGIGFLEFLDASGWRPLRQLSIDAGLAPLVVQLEPSLSDEVPAGPLALEGWCFHPQLPIERLEVRFLDTSATAEHGVLRDDVAAMHPGVPLSRNSGFRARLVAGGGVGPLVLVARLADGSIATAVLREALTIATEPPGREARAALLGRAARIQLPTPADPEVSVIVPVYNQIELTVRCLETLVEHAGSTRFEVLVVDDCSPDPATCALALVRGLRLIRNAANAGFVDSCNRGAREAKGRFVLFLNSDTEVSPGWMEALLAVFVRHPKAGAAGAMLLYPDGTLQEAGGLIWADGTGWNYGRGDDPRRPDYRYLRESDYCSGACLAVPRELFFQVGGFDTRFRPGYYEDADLAFSLRAAGHPVYFQPEARILHREGSSSGTDTRAGMKRHQIINRERFREKWAEVLARHNSDPAAADLARDRHAGARILVIDACALTPDMDAGSLRMFNLLRILARQGLKVTFAAANLQFHEPFSSQLQQEGVEHLGVPHIYSLGTWLEANAFAFDVILLSRKHIANQFVALLRRCAPASKIVFDTVDLMYVRLARQAEIEGSEDLRAAAEQSRQMELELCRSCDRVYVVSQDERETLGTDIPAEKIDVVPLIHDVRRSPVPFAARTGVLFVGGYQHPPNLDAVEYFLDAILPLVHRQLPGLEVHIVGSNTPERLRERASALVHIHGFVQEIEPFFDRVRLSIAPLRYGAGVKGKVNQSMSHGVPVIATSIAAEGMHLQDGQDVLLGDTPEDFASALVKAYTDEALWNELADGGVRNIETHFSFPTVERALMRSIATMTASPRETRLVLPTRPAARYELGEVLRFGHNGNASPYLDGGWSEQSESVRWAVGRRTQLRFRLGETARPSRIEATLFPLLVPGRLPRQRLELVLPEGVAPSTVTLSASEPTPVQFTLPANAVVDGGLTLQFLFPDATSPASLGLSGDVRPLSVAFLSLRIH